MGMIYDDFVVKNKACHLDYDKVRRHAFASQCDDEIARALNAQPIAPELAWEPSDEWITHTCRAFLQKKQRYDAEASADAAAKAAARTTQAASLPGSQAAKMTTKAQESAKARDASESAKPPTPRLNSPSAQRPASPLGSAGAGRARALALASERGPTSGGSPTKKAQRAGAKHGGAMA